MADVTTSSLVPGESAGVPASDQINWKLINQIPQSEVDLNKATSDYLRTYGMPDGSAFPQFPSVGGQNIQTNPIPNVLSGRQGVLPTNQNSVDFKVRLVSVLDMVQGAPGNIKQVIFNVTPTLSESGTVEYNPVQPIHMPGSIQIYKNTNSRTFEITAHFISRSGGDALINIQYLQILRSWTRPFFGNSNTNFASSNSGISTIPNSNIMTTPPYFPQDQSGLAIQRIQGGGQLGGGDTSIGVNLLGAPPEVLYLYGYSSSANDNRQFVNGINLNRIPVVITSLNITYPEDVDYIPACDIATNGLNAYTEPFPIKMDVSISLVETHSPAEYEQFSLTRYKNGNLQNF